VKITDPVSPKWFDFCQRTVDAINRDPHRDAHIRWDEKENEIWVEDSSPPKFLEESKIRRSIRRFHGKYAREC